MSGAHLTHLRYEYFGHIVANYARAETGFKFITGQMLGLPLPFSMILFAPYATAHVRNVCKSVAKLVLHDEPKLRDQLVHLIGRHKSHSLLRNDVAHNMWAGAPDGSIKPMYADVRNERPDYFGFKADDRSYSDEALRMAASDLQALNHELIAFGDGGALAAAIAAKADLNKIDVESIVGISTTDS